MWIKIKNFEQYELSRNGEVRRMNKKGEMKILKHWVNSKKSNDYLRVSLFRNSKQTRFLLHRLIALHFIDNPENKPQVNHIDGNRQNYEISNLEWVTRSENSIHAVRVLKSWKHPNPMAGKFGKDHNTSKQVVIKYPDGSTKEYGSAYEYERITGENGDFISWARCRNPISYTFAQGKRKGVTLYF